MSGITIQKITNVSGPRIKSTSALNPEKVIGISTVAAGSVIGVVSLLKNNVFGKIFSGVLLFGGLLVASLDSTRENTNETVQNRPRMPIRKVLKKPVEEHANVNAGTQNEPIATALTVNELVRGHIEPELSYAQIMSLQCPRDWEFDEEAALARDVWDGEDLWTEWEEKHWDELPNVMPVIANNYAQAIELEAPNELVETPIDSIKREPQADSGVFIVDLDELIAIVNANGKPPDRKAEPDIEPVSDPEFVLVDDIVPVAQGTKVGISESTANQISLASTAGIIRKAIKAVSDFALQIAGK